MEMQGLGVVLGALRAVGDPLRSQVLALPHEAQYGLRCCGLEDQLRDARRKKGHKCDRLCSRSVAKLGLE